MIPAKFDYARAGSVDEAVALLSEHGQDAKLLAGGHSLLPLLKLRLAFPSLLVDVGRVEELTGVTEDDDELVIGAGTTHRELIDDPLIARHCGVLAEVTREVGDVQVRNRGTLGGAAAHADPASDQPAALLALDATFVAEGPDGRRGIPAAEFFRTHFTSALEPDEVLVAVRVPKLDEAWGWHYEKFQRVAQAWAVVGVCALVRAGDDAIGEARVGLANMGRTPLRAGGAEDALAGVPVGDTAAISEAADHASEGTDPPSDHSAGSDYRQHLARVLTRRAVTAALG